MSTENNDAISSLSSNSREASPPTAVFAKWIAIMAAIAIALVLFGVKPALEGFFGNNTAIANQKTQNQSNQTTHDDLMQKQANLQKTQTDVNEFLKSFPAGSNQREMFDELNAIAAKNGVTINSITPSKAGSSASGSSGTAGSSGSGAASGAAKPVDSDVLAAINLDLSITGSNPNGFLQGLETANRVFVINSFSYAGDASNKGTKSMSIKATTYVVQPLVTPSTVGQQSQSQAQPSSDPTNVPAK